MAFLVLWAFLFVFLGGFFLCLHLVFSKKRMVPVVDQYVTGTKESGSGGETKPNAGWQEFLAGRSGESVGSAGELDSVFSMLDSGNREILNEFLNDPRMSSILNEYGSIGDMTGLSEREAEYSSMMPGGLSGLLSGFSTMMKVFKGEIGLVSLLLNYVDAERLLTVEMIDEALADPGVAPLYTASEQAGSQRQAFLHTKLASHITMEAAYAYFDSFRHEKTGEDWRARLQDSLVKVQDEREQDLSFLVGHAVGQEDRELVRALKLSLANSVVSHMSSPDAKANSLSDGMQMLLGFFFSSRFFLVLLIIGLILMAMILVIHRAQGKPGGTMQFGVILTLSGLLLVLMVFFKNQLIGPFYHNTGSGFYVMMIFVIVGLMMAAIGILTLVVPSFARRPRQKRGKKGQQVEEAVPSFGEIEAISRFGLSDLLFKQENPNRKSDGLVDYYGDGRGLAAQREYQKKKAEEQEKNHPDAVKQNPEEEKEEEFGYPPIEKPDDSDDREKE